MIKMKNELKKTKIMLLITLLGVLALGVSIGTIYYNDMELSKGIPVEFMANESDVLRGTYYEGTKDAGIILLEGFGSDQVTCKSVASEFVQLGFHVMTFDFSGHGRSLGTLRFDNAETNRLANQTIAAKEVFKTLSGLEYDEILLWGHSMGARVALQSQTFDPNPIEGLILFGIQVNLVGNIQSSFFTGVNDSALAWVQSLDLDTPSANLIIITGTLDDICTPEAATALYNKLGGDAATFDRELVVLDYLFHNYEVYSPSAITIAMNWAVTELNLESNPDYVATGAFARKICWIFSLIGLFMMTIGGGMYLNQYSPSIFSPDIHGLKITSMKKFILDKLKGWVYALPIILGIMFVLFVVPGGVPVFNLIYVAFIGGYGILYLIRYKRNRVGGLSGELKAIIDAEDKKFNERIIYGVIAATLLTVFAILFANTGIYFVFPMNNRLIWLFISTLFTIPGYLIAQLEMQLLNTVRKKEKSIKHIILLNVIGLFPFFLYLILFLSLQSYSGMLGGLQGVIIMLFVIASGYLVNEISKNMLVTAVFQALLIQLLVLPQGVLFGIF